MALDWSRGSARRGGPLDWSRGSSRRSASGSDLDRSSSKAKNANGNPQSRQSAYLRHMSGLVADPLELDLDQRRLQSALREVGECSFGVDAIAVWMVDEETGKLAHPRGGWYCKMNNAGKNNVALARLEDSGRDDYVPPLPVSPGTDIAGILWAESHSASAASTRRSSLRRAFDSGVSLKSMEAETSNVLTLNYHAIRWRDLRSIEEDPDSATGPRLRLMVEAGFMMAAGITFTYAHHRGMVIFLTTLEDDDRLEAVTDGAYLYQAAQYIGATLSLAEIRRASLAERYMLKEKCYSIRNLGATMESSETTEQGAGSKVGDATTQQVSSGKEAMLEKHDRSSDLCRLPPSVNRYLRKLKGGSMQVPPSLPWRQTAWTIFGSFCGLLVLSSLNEYYKLLSDDDYFLLIGPFGAMCTLMYGLSAAPASQPRNAVMGQAIAGAISLAFTYIPDRLLPVWLRTAIGPAFAIGAMVKLGVVHPPAGAHSVLYASGKYNFAFYALVVLSTTISVIPATVVNNMSSKRQYPTYWHVGEGFLSRALSLLGNCGSGKSEAERSGCQNSMNLAVEKPADPTGDDGPIDGGKRGHMKVLPNRLVIHEEDEDDENSSRGSERAVISV